MLTQALLRESVSATSAIVMSCIESSSTTNLACSRMLSGFCRVAPTRAAMPADSSSPQETYGTHSMPSFVAQR